LGMKAAMLASLLRRPVPALAKEAPEASRYALWHDTLGLDSAHDYDPVWAKCLELGIPPTFHSASSGIGLRTSISNFVYNHIGHFGAAGEAVCKALFIGGGGGGLPPMEISFFFGGGGGGGGPFFLPPRALEESPPPPLCAHKSRPPPP